MGTGNKYHHLYFSKGNKIFDFFWKAENAQIFIVVNEHFF